MTSYNTIYCEQLSNHPRPSFTMHAMRCTQRLGPSRSCISGASKAGQLRSPCLRVAIARPRSTICKASAPSVAAPHLQLATAKLPATADPEVFAESMYQWAATITQSGANFPMILPVQADKLQSPPGFKIALLRRGKTGGLGSVGDIVGTVEDAPGVGKVLMVRFYEGPVAQDVRNSPPPADPTERLEVILQSMPDVDTIMNTMPKAIRAAAQVSTP